MNNEETIRTAATELLEALIDAEALLVGPMNGRDWGARRQAVLSKARAAINKANGGTR